jgi:hypothetical protein
VTYHYRCSACQVHCVVPHCNNSINSSSLAATTKAHWTWWEAIHDHSGFFNTSNGDEQEEKQNTRTADPRTDHTFVSNFESIMPKGEKVETYSPAGGSPVGHSSGTVEKKAKSSKAQGDESSSDEFYNVLKPIAGASLASQSRKVLPSLIWNECIGSLCVLNIIRSLG